jgi:hypothetical protein
MIDPPANDDEYDIDVADYRRGQARYKELLEAIAP